MTVDIRDVSVEAFGNLVVRIANRGLREGDEPWALEHITVSKELGMWTSFGATLGPRRRNEWPRGPVDFAVSGCLSAEEALVELAEVVAQRTIDDQTASEKAAAESDPGPVVE